MPRYTVVSLDVWGNANEGYEVNDMWMCGTIEMSECPDNVEIYRTLVDGGYISPASGTSNFKFGDDCELLTIDDARDGMPVFQLRQEVSS